MIVLSLLVGVLMAHAEEKVCAVKGMECQNCVDMVTKSICSDAYSTCKVRVIKKGLGEITLATKDPAAIIDQKALDVALDKLTYSIESCAAPKTAAKVRR